MWAWVEYVSSRLDDEHCWRQDFQFGDWLDPDAPTEQPWRAKARLRSRRHRVRGTFGIPAGPGGVGARGRGVGRGSRRRAPRCCAPRGGITLGRPRRSRRRSGNRDRVRSDPGRSALGPSSATPSRSGCTRPVITCPPASSARRSSCRRLADAHLELAYGCSCSEPARRGSTRSSPGRRRSGNGGTRCARMVRSRWTAWGPETGGSMVSVQPLRLRGGRRVAPHRGRRSSPRP